MVGMFLLFVDFYTKAYVYHIMPTMDYVSSIALPIYKKVTVFENFFGIDFFLNLTMNRGAAWGMFSNFQLPLEVVRICVVFALLIFLFFFSADRKKDIPFLFIIVGAIGNIIDYFLYGSVVDFFHFNLWGYNFPVFNIADILITCGVASLFILVSRKKHAVDGKYAA